MCFRDFFVTEHMKSSAKCFHIMPTYNMSKTRNIAFFTLKTPKFSDLLSFFGNPKIVKLGPRGILCTRGEKAHTSKRVSVIARDNAILKEKCATCTLGFSEPQKKRQNLI